MNWFKSNGKNAKGTAVATVGDSVENSATSNAGEQGTQATDFTQATSKAPGPPSSLDDPVAWLKSLEPKANPKLVALKRKLHQKVITDLDVGSMARWNSETLRVEVRRQTEVICATENIEGLETSRETLIKEVLDEVFGLGPLEPLRADHSYRIS